MKTILRYKKFILIFSSLVVALSITSVMFFGFRLGIDFTSGSLWQIKAPNTTSEDINNFFKSNLGIEDINVSLDSSTGIYTLTFKEISEAQRQTYLNKLQDKFGDGVSSLDFWTISPSVSTELRHKALWAIVLVLVGISLYISFAFRKVSRPIRSWKYGIITLVTLVHDVSIPAGVFAILGTMYGVTIDTNFIVAMLFVMGFSVHDTIVVFDRIRENLLIAKENLKGKFNLEEIIDKSIIETVARSVNTSLTLIIILLTIFFFGPVSTKMFILAILIGTIAGTYSSIFFASPQIGRASCRERV